MARRKARTRTKAVDKRDLRQRLGLLREYVTPRRVARAAGVSERTAKGWLSRGKAPDKYVGAIRKLSGNVAGAHRRMIKRRYGVDLPTQALVPTFQGTRYDRKTHTREPWHTLEFDVSHASPERFQALYQSLIEQGYAVRVIYKVSARQLARAQEDEEDNLLTNEALRYGASQVSTEWSLDPDVMHKFDRASRVRPLWIIAQPGLGIGSSGSGFKHYE